MKKKTIKKREKVFIAKKMCKFCEQINRSRSKNNKQPCVNYKNIDLLRKFVSEKGRIIPRQVSGVCAKHQRVITKAIKRARNIALLPG